MTDDVQREQRSQRAPGYDQDTLNMIYADVTAWPTPDGIDAGELQGYLLEMIEEVEVTRDALDAAQSRATAAEERERRLLDVVQSGVAVEALAAQAHEAWSGWMDYMIPRLGLAYISESGWVLTAAGKKADKVTYDRFDGCLTRWVRQMQTPYDELPEDEKESDRVEARRYISAALAALDGSEGAG